jgi:hypothetical protein
MTEVLMVKSPAAEMRSADVMHTFSLYITELTPIVEELSHINTLQDKLAFLDSLQIVKNFFNQRTVFLDFLNSCSLVEEYLIKALVVIRQAEEILPETDLEILRDQRALLELLDELKVVESFYSILGGVIGYHLNCLKLLYEQENPCKKVLQQKYYPPFGIDVDQKSAYLKEAIIEGIASQGSMGELYPVGGAADRLKLQDEKMHCDLPAARLEFLGRSLLAGMIRDLQAREFLHFKLYGKQLITPVALMTSLEKNNDYFVKEILEENHYFGRPRNAFRFFSQPLVPTLSKEGKWCLREPLKLLLKPGGHGVIWKLALEEHIFKWFDSYHRNKMLVRQVNNPVAGVDQGLIALTGIGCKEKKAFGFASCLRRVKTSEGMNLLKETLTPEGIKVVLSNVEYCDFEKHGIQDVSISEEEPYSIFPSNTNILFAELSSIARAVKELPYPGMLMNFKEMKYYKSKEGEVVAPVARLELLMQNIADGFEQTLSQSLQEEPQPDLDAFITFNKRYKTISPTKKQFIPGSGLVETALGCFYDYLKNAKELLEEECHFSLPELYREDDFLQKAPSFIVMYHPALGPLYSVIGQKIRTGSLTTGSELQLEIADVNIENLHVEGSLIIEAKHVMGHYLDHALCYSHETGRCFLKNVTIKNRGIDTSKENIYWKNTIHRTEKCQIYLEGFSEFIAQDVLLEGDYSITVKDGERMIAKQEGEKVVFYTEPLTQDAPYWSYAVTQDFDIHLTFNERA